MARTIFVDDIERVQAYVVQSESEIIEPIGAGKRAYDYVSFKAEGPLAGLIWKEVRKVLKRARLTDLQAAVTEMHLLGKSDPEIAIDLERVDGVERTRQAVRDVRMNANSKLGKMRHLGILTVLYEEFNKTVINEYQTDKFEEMLKKRQL